MRFCPYCGFEFKAVCARGGACINTFPAKSSGKDQETPAASAGRDNGDPQKKVTTNELLNLFSSLILRLKLSGSIWPEDSEFLIDKIASLR